MPAPVNRGWAKLPAMYARTVEETGFFFLLDEPVRIVAADGDAAVLAAARAHLAASDVTLETFADAEAAFDRLIAGDIDLLLLGLDLPGGFDLIVRLRADERLMHLPVVVVAPREDAGAIGRAFEAGATSFVVKPLNPLLLRYQLRYVLRACQQEAAIRAAKARAEQAAAIKANVLRLVQHELRTPLTSIVGFAEHIAAHPRTAETAEFARLIADAGRRFAGNVADLMAAAQLLTADIQPNVDECAAASLIEAVVAAEADAAAERGVTVRAMNATDVGRIVCDRDLVARALRHLVRNAIQHGEGPVDVMASRERGSVVFAVRDRGQGVPDDRRETLFEAFQQGDDALHRSAQGLGLGLPVARRIFAAHGGTLTLSHVAGIGCMALATLPQ